jgi:hypothetical protein
VSLRIFTALERPDLGQRGRATSAVWPEYNVHSPVSARYWEPNVWMVHGVS